MLLRSSLPAFIISLKKSSPIVSILLSESDSAFFISSIREAIESWEALDSRLVNQNPSAQKNQKNCDLPVAQLILKDLIAEATDITSNFSRSPFLAVS